MGETSRLFPSVPSFHSYQNHHCLGNQCCRTDGDFDPQFV